MKLLDRIDELDGDASVKVLSQTKCLLKIMSTVLHVVDAMDYPIPGERSRGGSDLKCKGYLQGGMKLLDRIDELDGDATVKVQPLTKF